MKTYNTNPIRVFTAANIQNRPDILIMDEELQEDTAQLRECLIIFLLDRSGSMVVCEDEVYEAVQQSLMSLAQQNKTNLKVSFRAKIVLYNDSVYELNDTPLPPEQLAEVFTRDMYRCSGGTNLSAMIDYTDKAFSRTSPMVTSRKKGDCKITIANITDFAGTDNPAARQRAIERINHNRLANQIVNHICVFVGSEHNKKEAVLLAGSEDNIIALNKDLSERLAPTLINTTITYVDSTHIDYDESNQTPSSVGKQALEHQDEGRDSAEAFAIKELEDKLDDLLG